MKKISMIAAVMAAIAVAGCANTIRGAGADARNTGAAIEDAVQ